MRVKEVVYNWYQAGSTIDIVGAGEYWEKVTVGSNGVSEILEHLPQGEGDRLRYLVKYNDGKAIMIFNPNTVEYFKTV